MEITFIIIPVENHLMLDDRIQEIARSMFIKKQSYDCIMSEFCLTKPQFKKAKSLALKELRALIFN